MFYQKKKNSKSNIVYYYECENVWNKEKKRYECKRRLIGRWDPVTETVVPTDGRRKKAVAKDQVKEQSREQAGSAPAAGRKARKAKPDYQALYQKEVEQVQILTSLIEEKNSIIAGQAKVIEELTAKRRES